MSAEKRIIDLYIHPDNGPTLSMKLDMLAVEVEVLHNEMYSNHDQARIEVIKDHIKKRFPHVHPDAREQALRSLIGRLAYVGIYDGIVLRLPGTIDGPPPPKDYTQDFLRMREEVNEMKLQVERVTQERDKAVALRHHLETENQSLRDTHQVQLERIESLSHDLDEAEEGESHAVDEQKRAQQQMDQIEQERASLEAKLEKSKQDQQMTANLQRVVAELRPQLAEARAKEQQFRDALKKCEENNERLHHRINQLGEQATVTATQSDETKDPWLD